MAAVQVERYQEQRERAKWERAHRKDGEAPSKRPRLDTGVPEEGVGGACLASARSTVDITSFSPLVCIHTGQ